MSETIAFDDIEMLGGGDLKAVFDKLSMEEVVAALWGANAGLRGRLLRALPKRHAQGIEQAIAAPEHQTFEQVRSAQQKVVTVICQMSRDGQIAFDVPEDMVA